MTTFTALNPDYANRVRASFALQHFMTTLGASLSAIEPGFVEIRQRRWRF